MKFINELLRQFTPDEKTRKFAEEEGLLSDRQGDVQALRDISIRDFLEKPKNAEYIEQYPLNEDFSRYLALQLILKEKETLDAIYMELAESGQLSLKENTDLKSLTGLFWTVIMERQKAEENKAVTDPFKLDIQKLLAAKEKNAEMVNSSIAEVNGFKEEMAKLHEGLTTYTHQIDKLLKEKANLASNAKSLASLIIVSEEEERVNGKIVEGLKILESKIKIQHKKLKSLKVFKEGTRKKFCDESGNTVDEEKVKEIKNEYRKLLVMFGEEEEKIKKSAGTSVENKLQRTKIETKIEEISENINNLEKTRKAYQDYKIILNGKYEKVLDTVFKCIERGERIDSIINAYHEFAKSLQKSLNNLDSSVESSFVFLQEVQLERQEMERLFESCKMQQELIEYEYSSLEGLFADIDSCKKTIEEELERHKSFTDKFDAITKDFTESKIKGNLLNPEKIGFFQRVLIAKLEESKKLNKQYNAYKKLHETLLQNYRAITRSLQKNEKQYLEQFVKVSEGRDTRFNKTSELEATCNAFSLKKDYLKLFLLSSPLEEEQLARDLVSLEDRLSLLSLENARAADAIRELKEYELVPFRKIRIVNELLEEFDERDVVVPETIESFIEELNELVRLDKELGGLGLEVDDVEENTVSSEIIKSMTQQIADLADELAASKKDHGRDVTRNIEAMKNKDREINQFKAEVDKLAKIIIEDHGREEKLLNALQEERNRNKEIHDYSLSVEERYRELANAPFWKKNFVNTFSTIFFVGGLFYSIISDLPWERMQLSRAIPFIEAPAPLHEREMFLFAEKEDSGVQGYLTKNSYVNPSTDRHQHLILDLHQYKVSVDASSFLNIYEDDFKRSDIEDIVVTEINRFCKEKRIDFKAFLQFYKGVYPNGLILTKETIQQATNTIYALWEDYADNTSAFRNLHDEYDYSNNVLQLFGRLQLKTEDPYSSFIARMFNEFHTSGYSPAEAKEALLNNLASIRKQYRDFFTPTFKGDLKPDEKIENMNVHEFVNFVTPYIKKRYYSFARQNKSLVNLDVDSYVRGLAEDIFYSTELFHVPKTMAILVAHQETFFHNMLGDQGLSEGPFQIYRPTKRIILNNMRRKNIEMPKKMKSLLKHKTFSTFMAVFHMSKLMSQYSFVSFQDGKGYIEYDLRRCTISYNGSTKYYHDILKKKEILEGYTNRFAAKSPLK